MPQHRLGHVDMCLLQYDNSSCCHIVHMYTVASLLPPGGAEELTSNLLLNAYTAGDIFPQCATGTGRQGKAA